ncbi:MAG TPA: glycosyltransferase family 2 protein [Candidatus Limnocylindrales bacterium]|nr:glycosyltransferase family 2 protein [Candidatus Limnocylindrales bacterium]
MKQLAESLSRAPLAAAVEVSVVLPVYNEQDNIEPLHAELTEVLSALGRSYEIIYTDDGSRDRSPQILRRIQERDSNVRVVLFRRNFGQTAAVAAGLERTRGAIVVTLDSDRQNDPRDIPRLIAKLEEGYDLVSGWRQDRKDELVRRRMPSVAANAMIRAITGVHIHDYGCMLKAYRGEVARSLRLYGEMHRFIPAIACDLGAKVTEIVVNHRPRVAGSSKYGLSRVVRVVLDLLTVKFLSVYSTRPIHVFGVMGVLLGGAGAAVLALLGVQKIVFGMPLAGRPILLLAILLVVTGVQLVTMGLLGEMLARTYHESQGKPIYVVAEELGEPISKLAGPPMLG